MWITTNCGLFVSAGDSSTQTGKSGSVSYGVTRKGRFSFQPQKKGNVKECSNYDTTAVISHASKVIVKILQARLQQYVNGELQMFNLDLEKAEEPLPTSVGSSKKQETVWITTNCGKFLKRWE